MIIPVQVTFQDVPQSDEAEARIRDLAEKLDQYHPRLTSCRVVVTAPQQRRRTGNPYHINISVTVPGAEVVVNRRPGNLEDHDNLFVAVRDAFDAMARKLRKQALVRRGKVKSSAVLPHGRVNRLFPQDRYGFIEAPDGREIYFHGNSVLDDGFGRLEVGTEVRFSEEEGEKGPKATTVEIVGRHARHRSEAHGL